MACYYDVLGITDHLASPSEIRRAYHRLALELHPDKILRSNCIDLCGGEKKLDSSAARFVSVQLAYELLSNPIERAWYDDHRQQILSSSSSSSSSCSTGGKTTTYGHNHHHNSSGGLRTYDLLRYFAPNAYKTTFSTKNTEMDDDYEEEENQKNKSGSTDFYAVFESVFLLIAQDELKEMENCFKNNNNNLLQSQQQRRRPLFGSKNTPEDNVNQFYNHWRDFETLKTFSWCDIYRPMDAQDRRTRRLMEKKNQKLRESSKKTFSETVRKLVEHCARRDERLKIFAAKNALSKQRENISKSTKIIRKQNSNISSEEHLSNYYIEPDWAKIVVPEFELEEYKNNNNNNNNNFDNDGLVVSSLLSDCPAGCPGVIFTDDDDDELEDILEAHFRTPLHKSRVEKLRRILMEADNSQFKINIDKDEEINNNYSCKTCIDIEFKTKIQLEAHMRSRKHLKELRKRGVDKVIPSSNNNNSFNIKKIVENKQELEKLLSKKDEISESEEIILNKKNKNRHKH